MREHYVFGERWFGELTDARALELLRLSHARAEALAQVPTDRILAVLDRASQLWADPDYPGRREVLERVPAEIGFSVPMVEQELESLVVALSRPYLEQKIETELGSIEALDIWQGDCGKPFRRARPRGLVLHVSAGNVFTGGILSTLEGIVTKNVNFLKTASSAPLFPLLFAQSLKECDPEGIVAGNLAILSWSGSASKVHRIFQQHCDAIVVWGAEDVVKTYREGLGLKTHVIEYGPKVSFAAIARERLGADEAAREVARSVAIWDQNACSSPQVLYLEAAGPEDPAVQGFMARLRAEMTAIQQTLPLGPLSLQEKAELTKEREMARFAQAMGEVELHTPGRAPDWTLILERDAAFKLSPLMRTLYVKCVADLADLPAILAPYGDSLQSAGVLAPPERMFAIADRLCAAGVLRVTALGEMSGGTPGEPHDGVLALQELTRWVSLGFAGAEERFDGAEWLGAEELEALNFGRRQRLLHDVALRSPYHRARIGHLRLEHPDDWLAVPVMEREELVANTPPMGADLFVKEPSGGHYLRSGGTTASPKLSVFSYEDYEADMRRAARGAYAAGLRPTDRVANLFYSGGLYGSFLSVNRAVEIVGCHNFPFTSSVPPEQLPEFLRIYGIDTLMGLPSWLLRVFDAIKADGEGIRIRKVFYTGEHLYPSEQAYLREAFGIEIIGSIGYGTVDAGPIGFQCPHCRGGVHHVHSDHQFVEILDRRTRQPAEPGGFGEVLITNLNRTLMPLIRYRIGDLGRRVDEPCPCGRTMPRFELLGRSDDVLVIGGMNLLYADLQDAASALPGVSSMIQLHAARRDNADQLTIRAELVGENASLNREALAEQLHEAIARQVPEIPAALAQGLIARVVCEVLPAGALPRLERTGKVKRIIDERVVIRT